MNYAILRTAKLKTMGNIGGSLAHNYRTIETPNTDPNLTPKNHHSVATPEAVKQVIKDRLPEKRRSDAVLCIEYLITASPEWEGWGNDKEEEFFKRASLWLIDKHGAENIAGLSIHRDISTAQLVAYVVPIDQRGKLNCKDFLGGRVKLSQMQTDFANAVADLGLTRGKEGSKAKHTGIKAYYHDINNARDFSITAELPRPELFESKASYGEKVISAVIKQIEPTVKAANSILMEYEKVRVDKRVAEGSYEDLKKRVEPYLVSIQGLNQEEIARVNEVMQLESRRIAVEKDKIKQAIRESDQSQKVLKSRNMSKQDDSYSPSPRYKQNKVTGTLQELENLNNPAVLDEVKNKLLDGSEKVDRLLDSKAYKKGSDISR